MKRKKPSMEELKKLLNKIHKNPKMVDIAKDFVSNLGSKA